MNKCIEQCVVPGQHWSQLAKRQEAGEVVEGWGQGEGEGVEAVVEWHEIKHSAAPQ